MKEPMNVSKIKFYGFTPKETVFFEVHNLVNGKPSLITSYGGYSGFNTALERMKELVKISEKSEYPIKLTDLCIVQVDTVKTLIHKEVA